MNRFAYSVFKHSRQFKNKSAKIIFGTNFVAKNKKLKCRQTECSIEGEVFVSENICILDFHEN